MPRPKLPRWMARGFHHVATKCLLYGGVQFLSAIITLYQVVGVLALFGGILRTSVVTQYPLFSLGSQIFPVSVPRIVGVMVLLECGRRVLQWIGWRIWR